LAANESRFHVYTFDKIKQIKDNTWPQNTNTAINFVVKLF
jgi:hypothetical protein